LKLEKKLSPLLPYLRKKKYRQSERRFVESRRRRQRETNKNKIYYK